MKKYFLINAFGKDRPGIVAELSKILYENGFNLENSTMTRLADEFTIMLVVSTDKNIDENKFKNLFKDVEDRLGLKVYTKEIEYQDREDTKSMYRIVVYGADKPGIVYNVAKTLANENVNIVDMTTEKSNDIYVLIANVEIPDNLKFEDLREKLKDLQDEIGIDVACEKIEVIEL